MAPTLTPGHRHGAATGRERRPVAVGLIPLVAALLGVLGCFSGGANVPGAGAPTLPSLATIPVGKPPILLALSPDGARLYATSDDGKLAIIDADAVTQAFDVPPYSTGIAVAPDGRRVVVTNLFGNTLTVLDAARPALAQPITLLAQFQRGGYGRMAISPDSGTAYIVNKLNSILLSVALDSGALDHWQMDMRPADIALLPSGDAALVCGCKNFCVPGTCRMFDTRSQLFSSYISVGANPYRVAIDARGSRAYVTGLGDASLTVIDVATRQPLATVRVPVQPTGLAISSDGATVYVSSQTAGTLTAIDAASASVRATSRVAADAREVVLSPDGARAYVSTGNGIVVVETRLLGSF